MRDRQYWKFIAPLFVFAATCLMSLSAAHGQAMSLTEAETIPRPAVPTSSICQETFAPVSLKDAFRQVCLRKPAAIADSRNTIIIGFVGGFVKRNDANHPEVQFAAYLRDHYASGTYVEVFSNHAGRDALRQVEHLLDTDRDGVLSASEKQQARIIVYGHSWGASETVSFARELGQQGIPVLLTIQVDSIAKPGQKDSTIPPNVASAVNFYQSGGFLHGRSEILAADPARTKIIGNFEMKYRNYPINCDNYPWFARTFNKPHHEIENDPRVWDQLASLIDAELSNPRPSVSSSGVPEDSQFGR
ncbi:MAG TPA: hypothetical protein VN950_28860 [Terriglobales bacterium]|nr:hypothetical protein [Terriglobales bacterium]